MDISSASAAVAAGISNQVSVAVAVKVNDQQKAEGGLLLTLLEKSLPPPNANGKLLNTYA